MFCRSVLYFSIIYICLCYFWPQRVERPHNRSEFIRELNYPSAIHQLPSVNDPFSKLDGFSVFISKQLKMSYCVDEYKRHNLVIPATINEAYRSIVSSIGPVVIEGDGILAIVDYHQQLHMLTLTFRGSKYITNWVDNVMYNQINPWPQQPEIGIHKGFWGAYSKLKPQLLRVLRHHARRYNAASVVVSGHSLGGALSSIFAMDFSFETPFILGVEGVIMVGAPRIGNPAFARCYNALGISTWRIQHDHDYIPHIPSGTMFDIKNTMPIYYRHVGTLHMFDREFVNKSQPCSLDTNVTLPLWCLHAESSMCMKMAELFTSLQSHKQYFGVHITAFDCFSHSVIPEQSLTSVI